MSEIKSVYSSRTADISRSGESVWIDVSHPTKGHVTINVLRADLIAAVESELGVRIVPADAVVIERSVLPPVEPDEEGEVVLLGDATYRLSDFGPDRLCSNPRELALNLLAIAEYHAAHPPVDQATADALKKVVREFAATNGAYPISHRDGAAADARADGLVRALIERFEVTPKDGAR